MYHVSALNFPVTIVKEVLTSSLLHTRKPRGQPAVPQSSIISRSFKECQADTQKGHFRPVGQYGLKGIPR